MARNKNKGKGKSPKGRAGAKQKAQKGASSNMSSWGSVFVRSSDLSRQMLDQDYDDEPQKFFRGFAQGNQRNRPLPNPALKLRHQPITFVSASSGTPVESELENKLKLSEEAVSVAEDSEEDEDVVESEFDGSNIHTNIITDTDVEISEGVRTLIYRGSTAIMEQQDMSSDVDMGGVERRVRDPSLEPYPFIIDTVGDPSLTSGFTPNGKQPMRRDPSPARSDSSDEVVLFHGRNNKVSIANESSQRLARNRALPPQRSTPSQKGASPHTPILHAANTALSTLTPSMLDDATNSHSTERATSSQRSQYSNGSVAPHARSDAFKKPVQPEAKGWATRTSKPDAEVNPNATWAPAPSHPYWKKGKSRKPRPDLDPSSAEMRALDDAPARPSRVAFTSAQTDGPADEDIDSDTFKKIERLAKITRVQAKDDASPPKTLKKQAKMETRIGNIAMLESELSPKHVQLARRMGAEEAARLEQAAQDRERKREEKKQAPQQVSFIAASSSAAETTPDETTRTQSRSLVAYPDSDESDAEETIASLQADVKAIYREKEKARQGLREANEDMIMLNSAKSKRRGKRGRRKDNRHLRTLIMSDDEDSGEEAAYVDYMANLASQVDANVNSVDGRRDFAAMKSDHAAISTGNSFIVDGEELGVAETSHREDQEHQDEEDEEEEQDHAAGMMDDADASSTSTGPIGQDLSDLSSSDLEDELEYTEYQQWEDEEDLRRRRQERMTDEQIARLLAKQEELGIYGDEIVIENGEYGDISDGIGDVTAARAGLASLPQFSFGRMSNKHGIRRSNNRRNQSFPDASALADSVEQYGDDGFDIMDFDRPSLRPKNKGKRGQLPPELEALSDEELRGNMAEAWDNDRAKKRLKKAEREELRAQGMLGATGKKGKSDLGQKYQFGISTKQVHNELRTFLQNDGQNSRPFPPMDKHDRKELHDLANALNLNSKSVGVGKNRFPVLYKTSRTPVYRPEVFDKAVSASESGWLDRNRKYGKKLAKKAKAPKGGMAGGRVADATIRNGEVVGAGAAEIGKENFGHKLMEKMGWSKGMALGREGEGRLLPVEQVMRAGRGGLGESSW